MHLSGRKGGDHHRQTDQAVMGRSDWTVQVLDISPKVTLGELDTFFSYCGTVEKILLQKIQGQAQSAVVTFRQPYAYHTALLLNEAVLAGQPIRVLPLQDDSVSDGIHDRSSKKHEEAQELIPTLQATVRAVATRGAEMLSKTKDELDQNFKLSEKKRMLVDQTRSAISAAQQAAGSVRATISVTDYISGGATWISGLLDKASKWVYAMGNRKKDNPNSRKQK